MARLLLNKSQLTREAAKLAMYRRFLPALDLKRQQLMAEKKKAQTRLGEIEKDIPEQVASIGAEIPMLADKDIYLNGLIKIKSVEIVEHNVAGLQLPFLGKIEFDFAPYGYLVRPHWVDLLVKRLGQVLQLQVEAKIAQRRINLLDAAIKKVMQKINLFEKVLVPEAKANINRIQIALGDLERAAVVTSKIAKRKREAAAL